MELHNIHLKSSTNPRTKRKDTHITNSLNISICNQCWQTLYGCPMVAKLPNVTNVGRSHTTRAAESAHKTSDSNSYIYGASDSDSFNYILPTPTPVTQELLPTLTLTPWLRLHSPALNNDDITFGNVIIQMKVTVNSTSCSVNLTQMILHLFITFNCTLSICHIRQKCIININEEVAFTQQLLKELIQQF